MFATSLLLLGIFGRVQAAPMKLYIWGNVDQGDPGSFQVPNQEIDVTDGFPGYVQESSGHTQFGWPPAGWTKAIDGSITIGVALYDEAGQGLAYGYLRGRIEGEFTHYFAMPSNIGGGATGEAKLDPNSLSYYTLDRGTGLPIPSTIDRVPSWFYDLKATLVGQMTGGSRNIYETTLTIAAVAAVPEPGAVVVFLAAAGGGLLMLKRRAAS
ncbi:MAG: hypothetical protein BGO49_06380 [Planctomycetales bacterium 71-10]|nr:MAG: hypothetical protein BGO49_06380 [Planctomycetales bacterium 71-10]